MKAAMIAILIAGWLSGCAAIQQDTKAVAPPPPAPAAGANKTITVPNWPIISYVSEANDAFVVLGIKDPGKFPVPGEMEFKSNDGKQIIKMKPVVQKQDKPVEAPK